MVDLLGALFGLPGALVDLPHLIGRLGRLVGRTDPSPEIAAESKERWCVNNPSGRYVLIPGLRSNIFSVRVRLFARTRVQWDGKEHEIATCCLST